jgi:hypothetical protein
MAGSCGGSGFAIAMSVRSYAGTDVAATTNVG